jgi:RimJ/RimL family protein N-acetyltransferase
VEDSILVDTVIDHEKRERPVTLRDGTLVRLRPIRSDDGAALVALFGRLSERTIYQRFFTVRRSLPTEWVHLFTHVDYDRRMAIVAERNTQDGPEVVGVVRYDVTEPADTAEIAVVVEDAWQRQGLGTILLHAIMRAGEARGIRTFRVDVLAENRAMLRLLARETEIVARTTGQGLTEALVRPRAGAGRPPGPSSLAC